MPKLIIDEAARRIAAHRIAGRPVFGGPDGGLLAPGIIDLVDDETKADGWEPADERTRLLALGGEACRDLVYYAEGFVASETHRRVAKAMSVPVCSLMDVVAKLRAKFNDDDSRQAREAWPQQDQRLYKQVGRRLKKLQKGPLKTVRNKIGAHLDPEAYDDGRVSLKIEDLLRAMGDGLVLLMLALNHPTHSFTWIRGHGTTEDGQHRIVETMFGFPAAVAWLTDLEGQVKDVSVVRIAEDPRWQVRESLLAAVTSYNEMVSVSGLSMPTIWTAPSDELARAESGENDPTS